VAGLAAFVLVVAGVAAGIMPWPTLLALAAVPLVLQVYRGIHQHYDSPYTLMAFMGVNVKLHLYTGLLLLAGYLVTLGLAAIGCAPGQLGVRQRSGVCCTSVELKTTLPDTSFSKRIGCPGRSRANQNRQVPSGSVRS